MKTINLPAVSLILASVEGGSSFPGFETDCLHNKSSLLLKGFSLTNEVCQMLTGTNCLAADQVFAILGVSSIIWVEMRSL